MCIRDRSNQNDQHGGQGVPNFDYAMAQGVRKTFAKNYAGKLQEALEDVLDTDDESVLTQAAIAAGTEATGEEPRLQSQAATFDAAAAQQLVKDGRLDKEKATHVVRHARHRAEKATDRATYQAMEGFVHNLNTMHSRAGARCV